MMPQTSRLRAVPDSLRDFVSREVGRDEEVRWMGQPRPWRYAVGSVPIFLFGIPWTAFAVFWIYGAAGFKVPEFKHGFDFFPLFGVPFVLVGLGMLSSPLWQMRRARRTLYMVTSRRVLIFSGGRTMAVRSIVPEQLSEIQRRERGDGSGDIFFGPSSPLHVAASVHPGMAEQFAVAFLGIEDVQRVEQLLRELAATARQE